MINVSELESSVKKGLKAAYFIKGDDLYLVDYSKSVLKSLVTDGADEEFAVEVFEDFRNPMKFWPFWIRRRSFPN